MTYTEELLTKARQGMVSVCQDIQGAHAKAEPVAAILLLDLCWRANELHKKLDQLESAYSNYQVIN